MADLYLSNTADPQPMYILLTMAIFLNCYFFFLGTACIRLWFYKGALGPAPQKFTVLPKRQKDRLPKPTPSGPSKPAAVIIQDPKYCRTLNPNTLSHIIAVPPTDAQQRAVSKEERRISRLPAFVQDDCGDGFDFPDVPFATSPIEGLDPFTEPPTHT